MSKCDNCLFKSHYRDMGWSADVCTRGKYNLAEAIEACKNPKPCKWHITREKVIDIQTLNQRLTVNEFLKMVENICAWEERLDYQKIEEGIKRQMAKKGGAE